MENLRLAKNANNLNRAFVTETNAISIILITHNIMYKFNIIVLTLFIPIKEAEQT